MVARVAARDDLELLVASHDSQIKGIASQVGAIANKMDALIEEMHRQSNSLAAFAGRSPGMDAKSFMSTVIQAGAIIGACVTGIIYITQTSIAGKMAALDNNDATITMRLDGQKTRLERLENLLLYKGAGVPQTP